MRMRARILWVAVPLALLAASWAVGSAWLYGQLAREDWIPIVLSGLALIVALLTAIWSGFQQRRHLTVGFAMTLWEKWSEPDMRAARIIAWEALRSAEMSDGRKRLGKLRDSAPEKYEALALVNHFLADLHDFVEADLLDVRELKALFKDTLAVVLTATSTSWTYEMRLPMALATINRSGLLKRSWASPDRSVSTNAQDFHRYRQTFEANKRMASSQGGGGG